MAERAKGWMFLTNHAHVLLVIAREPDLRIRDIADMVGITERAAQAIVGDLIDEGYLTVTKEGRRNVYEVHRDVALRHPLMRDHDVGEIVKVLSKPKRGASRP